MGSGQGCQVLELKMAELCFNQGKIMGIHKLFFVTYASYIVSRFQYHPASSNITLSLTLHLRAKKIHFFLAAKQHFPGFFTFFYAIFKFLRPEHNCYEKFTSCST